MLILGGNLTRRQTRSFSGLILRSSTWTLARDRLRSRNHIASPTIPAAASSVMTRISMAVVENSSGRFGAEGGNAGGDSLGTPCAVCGDALGGDSASGARCGFEGGGEDGNAKRSTCTPSELLSEATVAVASAAATAAAASGRTPSWMLTDAELMDAM